MIGFEAIGSATTTVFDEKPMITTDPWIEEKPYFGSWSHAYKIPNEQTNLQLSILKAKKKLQWKPKLSIDDCISITVEWYKKVLINKESVSNITKYQVIKYMKKYD